MVTGARPILRLISRAGQQRSVQSSSSRGDLLVVPLGQAVDVEGTRQPEDEEGWLCELTRPDEDDEDHEKEEQPEAGPLAEVEIAGAWEDQVRHYGDGGRSSAAAPW